jgi:DNA mismatch endonuclease (patch repair protein)
MQANVGRETAAERLVRQVLAEHGLRFKTETRPDPTLRCKADVVFPRAKLCVFVDGCFWHGCKRHFAAPRRNSAWWTEKIAANVERDRRQTKLLRQRGWTVLRVWEHQLSESALLRFVEGLRRPRKG